VRGEKILGIIEHFTSNKMLFVRCNYLSQQNFLPFLLVEKGAGGKRSMDDLTKSYSAAFSLYAGG
jgi:hypothetical protein